MFAKKRVAIHGPKPTGLSILRDDAGVPHIQANSINDLNWGIGYSHATDRSTQLQMMRIIGQGRLCELLDDTDDNFGIDKFFRRMNWYRDDDAQLKKLDSKTREWCQALCDGINAGLAAKRISTLKLLGYHPEPWRIQDIFLTFRMTSYLTLAQSQAEVERLFIELAQSGVSSEKLAALFPIDLDNFDRELIEKIQLEERLVPSEVLWQTAAPRTMASNNWVVSGSKTASGAAIMANDPHLEVNRLPNVWYEMVLSCPEHQSMGYGMPGIPGLLIGRTPDISWGATYTFMDTVDSWVEECRDGKYKRGKSWRKFDTRIEHIKRKKHHDEDVTFYDNAHGVLEGDPTQEGYFLSTAWAPSLFGAKSLNASFQLTQASNTKQTMAALGEIESAWNWVIADTAGNIGYQMSGLCPKRKEGWNGFTPAPGWDASYDWQGFEPASNLPNAYNPECGYFVTANQDLNAYSKINTINMPMGDYRARRIEQCIEKSELNSVADMQSIQMDTFSIQADKFLSVLMPLLETDDKHSNHRAYDIFKSWDRHYGEHSFGAPLFENFYSELRKIVFGDQGFGEKAIEHLSQQSGLFIDFYQNFDDCLLNANSLWFEHINQKDAFIKAFEQASALDTSKTWGQVNRFTFTNILFQGKLPAWLGFDSEEVPMIGGRATPHQGQIYESAGRKTSFAPSVRIVADMSENVLHTRIAGGVSDNRFSPWYMSEVKGWLAGTFKTLKP